MKILQRMMRLNDSFLSFDYGMLFFRISMSVQLMVVHGFKKIGIGSGIAETVPNPFHFAEGFNQAFAIAANLIFPVFIICGWFTRFASIPILAVTLTGYFVVHGNDPLLERDIPFMYSIAFLLVAICGPGKYSIDGVKKTNLS